MIDVRRTPEFLARPTGLRDVQGRARITKRIDRLAGGNFGDANSAGDAKSFGHANSAGDGVGELRLAFGPGYRISFTPRGDVVVILLCGDKGSQAHDIERAKTTAREV